MKKPGVELCVVGVSYRSAPVAVRERVAIAGDERAPLLGRLREDGTVREAVLVSTCNRVEFYLSGADEHSVVAQARKMLATRVKEEDLRPYLYEHRGEDALRHVFRVAASLDSLVMGEPQILGQVKEAFETATEAEAVGGVLGRAMHRAFHVGKRVRTETALGAGQVSVASVAVDLAKRIFGDMSKHEVLLLGAGEIAESAARALVAAGVTKILIANRSFEKAEALARTIENAEPRSLGELPTLLEHADIVLVSTGASSFVVTREIAAAAVKRRKGRALFFVDVAVPRNVDPRVHDLDNCFRYDIDDLEQVVAEGMHERKAEAEAAERIVAHEVAEFAKWARQLEVTPTIVALREKVRSTLAAELDRSLSHKLKHLGEDDRKALGVMLEAAANKLLHAPTQLLKESLDRPDGEQVIALVRQVYDLPEDHKAHTRGATEGNSAEPQGKSVPVDNAAAPRH
ncbi:MAG: glutamyl-tRNA reductase [Myxococcales bacterium]|nr:glutamyl-tRNA reductase [Myxococcales bacterium]